MISHKQQEGDTIAEVTGVIKGLFLAHTGSKSHLSVSIKELCIHKTNAYRTMNAI